MQKVFSFFFIKNKLSQMIMMRLKSNKILNQITEYDMTEIKIQNEQKREPVTTMFYLI